MSEPLLIRCPSCGAVNRTPLEKVQNGLEPKCGRCRATLPAPGRPVTITDANFGQEVEGSQLPVLLDLWAPWCGPCRMLTPVIEALASELAGRIRVAKLNVDENPATAARFNVQGIPTLLVLKRGQVVDRIVGVQPKMEILNRIRSVVA